MNRENALRIAAALPPSSRVLDIGGIGPYLAATHISENLQQADVCAGPWPYPDKHFDYAICSGLLEKVRDPIWICAELQRVAKAGYAEVPGRILEQCTGVESPKYAGCGRHRWLIEAGDGIVTFLHKPHSLHSLKAAIVVSLAPNQQVAPRYEFSSLEWVGSFAYREKLLLGETETEREMIEFASASRLLPGLVVERNGVAR